MVIFELTIIRAGSFVNYAVEFMFMSMVLAGLAVFKFMQTDWVSFGFKRLHTLLQIIMPTLLIFYIASITVQQTFPLPPPEYVQACNKVSSIIQNTKEPILTENAGLAVVNGKSPYFEPFIFRSLVRQRLWDENKFIQDIDLQRFDYIILVSPIENDDPQWGYYSAKPKEGIINNYTLIYKYENSCWYGWYPLYVYRAKRLQIP